MPNKKGTGLLMVWADVPADKEAEFNRWYNEEHLSVLLAIPGVLNAARYEAVRSGPKHLACYELENAAVVESDAFKNRPRTEWEQRIGPRVIGTTLINNVYEMIHPKELTPGLAQADMAPALQIGRMDGPSGQEDEWNRWYSDVYVTNNEKVPGCIRGRRWKAVRGEPQYSMTYEFEHEKVSETPEWLQQQNIHPDNERMRGLMTHAPGSPGIWEKTFQP